MRAFPSFHFSTFPSFLLVPAFRARALDDEGDGAGREAAGQVEARDGDVVQAEGTLARLAVEVDVAVVVVALAFLLAHLVVDYPSAVLEGVYNVVGQEEGEGAEDARLVHRHHLPFQRAEAQGRAGAGEGLQYEDAVGGGADALGFQLADDML